MNLSRLKPMLSETPAVLTTMNASRLTSSGPIVSSRESLSGMASSLKYTLEGKLPVHKRTELEQLFNPY